MKQNLVLALIFSVTLPTYADERLLVMPSRTESPSFEWVECFVRLAETTVDAERAASVLDSGTLSRGSAHVPLFRLIAQPSFMGRYTPPPEGASVLTLYRTAHGEALVEFLLPPDMHDIEAAPLDGELATVLAEVLMSNDQKDHSNGWRTVWFDASRTYTALGGSPVFGSKCATAVGDLFGSDFAATRGGRIVTVLRDYASGAMTRRDAEAKLKNIVRK
jgi:hypothetical protein